MKIGERLLIRKQVVLMKISLDAYLPQEYTTLVTYEWPYSNVTEPDPDPFGA